MSAHFRPEESQPLPPPCGAPPPREIPEGSSRELDRHRRVLAAIDARIVQLLEERQALLRRVRSAGE